MIIQDMYSVIADRCSLDSTNSTHKTKMLDSTNEQLKKVFRQFNLQAERATATLTTTASTATYLLDPRVLKSINFRETSSPIKLDFMSRENFEREHPSPASTETGIPSWYVPLRKIRVQNQPTSASIVTVVSSSVSDTTSYFVIVKGISSGLLRTERLTLNGTTNVTSTNSYTEILSISKDTTNGTITATSNAAAVTNIALLPGEKEREYWEIRLHLIPDDAYTINYSFQYIPWALSYDEETIPLEDVFIDGLLAMITGDLLFKQGDSKYALWKAEAEKLLGEIEDRNYLAEDEDLRFGFPDVDYGSDI